MKRSMMMAAAVCLVLASMPARAGQVECVIGYDGLGDVRGIGNLFGFSLLSEDSPAVDLVKLAFSEDEAGVQATVEVADVDGALGTRSATAVYTVQWHVGEIRVALRAMRAAEWTFVAELETRSAWWDIPVEGTIDRDLNTIAFKVAWSDLGEIREDALFDDPMVFAEEKRNVGPDLAFGVPITYLSDSGPDFRENTYMTGSTCIPEELPEEEQPDPES